MQNRLLSCAAGALFVAVLTPSIHAQERGSGYFDRAETWSGFYAGVHGGVAEADKFPTWSSSSKAFAGGVQIGADWQVGSIVLGASAEGTYSHNYRFDLGTGAGLKQSWSGAVKARAGLAVEQLLVYGTLGYGVARLEADGTVTSPAANVGGVVFGGGVEYALSDVMSLKLEYQQARYNNVAYSVGGVNQSKNLIDHAVRAGLNFRF